MIEPNPSHKPNGYRPARDMSPAGVTNTSIAASGGQTKTPSAVDDTPSMDTGSRKVSPSPSIRDFTPLMD